MSQASLGLTSISGYNHSALFIFGHSVNTDLRLLSGAHDTILNLQVHPWNPYSTH
jgi:hypothetical protein